MDTVLQALYCGRVAHASTCPASKSSNSHKRAHFQVAESHIVHNLIKTQRSRSGSKQRMQLQALEWPELLQWAKRRQIIAAAKNDQKSFHRPPSISHLIWLYHNDKTTPERAKETSLDAGSNRGPQDDRLVHYSLAPDVVISEDQQVRKYGTTHSSS